MEDEASGGLWEARRSSEELWEGGGAITVGWAGREWSTDVHLTALLYPPAENWSAELSLVNNGARVTPTDCWYY